MRSDAERLQDVLEAIERIEKHAARGKGAFYKDELLPDLDSSSSSDRG
jgi:hypothetical protein